MTRLITVKKAKEEIQRLQYYIFLVETYEPDTIDKLIIKNYAITNKIKEVTKIINASGNEEIDTHHVSSVIRKKPIDELHKILRAGYMKKTRTSRKHKN
jgi:hypothetical protein